MKICYWLLLITLFLPIRSGEAADELTAFDKQVKQWAEQCRQEIVDQFNLLLSSGKLSIPQLFDTFYIPIPNTEPQKYRTQYDNLSDGVVQPIIDAVLDRDERLVFVVIVDRNGYLPTHNSRFSQPLTGDSEADAKSNRTKRIFNDRTGLAAARNKDPLLLQRYSRDTGEEMSDMSMPIMIQNRHWGALRIGYRQK